MSDEEREDALRRAIPVKTEEDVLRHYTDLELSCTQISKRSGGRYTPRGVGKILRLNGIKIRQGRPSSGQNNARARRKRAQVIIAQLIWEYLNLEPECPVKDELGSEIEKGKKHMTEEELRGIPERLGT